MSDTPSRCEPPEEWQQHESQHWLKNQCGDFEVYLWVIVKGEGYWACFGSPVVMAECGFIYHSPALPDAAAEIERLRSALDGVLRYVDTQTCAHEDTHRGGFLWTICDACGMKWADDEGGFQPHVDAPAVAEARATITGKRM